MLKTKIKASRITNLTDARYFSAWEVAYIGFNLEEGNDSYIPPVNVKAMKGWLEGPQFVGEFGSFIDVESVVNLVDALALDAIQVGTLCSQETIQTLHEKEIPIIKEITWNETSNWETVQKEYADLAPFVELFLIDFSQNSFSIDDMKEQIIDICQLHPTFIDADIKGVDAEGFLAETQAFGLAIKGGDEEKVGYKSFDDLDDIFEALEIFI
ncbi:MAG: phosphoribosylanthranilate isomerase [Maribacter sp.]|jgi:phosphoribosylanthranilate isomerase